MSDFNSPPPPRPAKHRRLLYVDDNPFLRRTVTATLEKHGYIVETANDGFEAWQKVLREPVAFEVIITDREMPRLDGIGLLRRLRDAKYTGGLIVFSNPLSPIYAAEFRTLEVDAIVEKGSAPESLVAAVAEVAGLSR
jgi:CheY-like chemotaxis protein